MVKNQVLNTFIFIVFSILFCAFSYQYYIRNLYIKEDLELIIGKSTDIPATWVGIKDVDKNIPILILAGHADS